MQKFILSFLLNSTDYRCPLSFTVRFDDKEVFSCDHVNRAYPVEIEITDTEAQTFHEIVLTMTGKRQSDTVLKDGQFLLDPRLIISNVTIDDIKIDTVFNQHSTYRHNGNGTQIKNNHAFFGTLGCNGDVTFRFSTPIFNWLLENS